MSEPLLVDDATRDATVERLSEALAVGRLTIDEFDERLDAALRARTDLDLTQVLRGLPRSAPVQAVSRSTPARAAWIRRPGAAVGTACVAVGLSLLVFVGVAVSDPGQDPPSIVVCDQSVDTPDC